MHVVVEWRIPCIRGGCDACGGLVLYLCTCCGGCYAHGDDVANVMHIGVLRMIDGTYLVVVVVVVHAMGWRCACMDRMK